jgi:hypothetical protein
MILMMMMMMLVREHIIISLDKKWIRISDHSNVSAIITSNSNSNSSSSTDNNNSSFIQPQLSLKYSMSEVIISPSVVRNRKVPNNQTVIMNQMNDHRSLRESSIATTTKSKKILYIITSIAQYNTGTRATTKGSDRLQETLIPVMAEGVRSMIASGHTVDGTFSSSS